MKKLLRAILLLISGALLVLSFYNLKHGRLIADDTLLAELYRNYAQNATVTPTSSRAEVFYYWQDFTVKTSNSTQNYTVSVPWWGKVKVEKSSERLPTEPPNL